MEYLSISINIFYNFANKLLWKMKTNTKYVRKREEVTEIDSNIKHVFGMWKSFEKQKSSDLISFLLRSALCVNILLFVHWKCVILQK